MESFYLVGHSFGSYVAGNYANKYHKYIKKMLLMSPLGTKVTSVAVPEELSETDFKIIQC